MPNTPHSSLNLSNIKAFSYRLSARGLPRHLVFNGGRPRALGVGDLAFDCDLSVDAEADRFTSDPADFTRHHVGVLRRRHHRVEMTAGTRNHDARRRFSEQR